MFKTKNPKRKRQFVSRQEAVAGLGAVRGVQTDMQTVQKMLGELGPQLQIIAKMSGRIDRLEAEMIELKRRH